ncbi:TetR/AcrR family transcriptional regulator [Kineococcus rubinsiae]|uniref:TetR/AcrR family transcriptional regulator n=1 Tax=Kineococcus rubinsiae TaxID=2609562 RepID=UPI001431933A|nr:TetR/AcrR family transcriptional regulator [Kineococcus rubinsiae]NIZ92209.1 TetR/AcrR family transcriptional regulator [Kineococcus rubinsiae]
MAEERGYAKGRARRQQILEEAVRLFGEVGYRAASLRELAQRCGLSHPGLLHHVGDKESLLLAVLAHRDAADAAETGLLAAEGADRLDALVEVMRRNASRRAIVELHCVLSAEATAADHPAHAFFAERYARTVASLVPAFPGEADPVSAARRVVALADGLQVQWLLDPDGVDMAAELSRHVAGLRGAAQAG